MNPGLTFIPGELWLPQLLDEPHLSLLPVWRHVPGLVERLPLAVTVRVPEALRKDLPLELRETVAGVEEERPFVGLC
jgi:hypothetical protein